MRIDTALLEASAPLLSLRNGSHLTSTMQLSYQAKVTSLGSLVKLDRSTLTIATGAATKIHFFFMLGSSFLRKLVVNALQSLAQMKHGVALAGE